MNGLQLLQSLNKTNQIPTQYVSSKDGHDTIICFHNYFDRVLRTKDVACDLHLFLFEDSTVQNFSYPVKSDSFVQIKTSALNPNYEGIIAVCAIPKIDLTGLQNLKIKSRPSTGFYVLWGKNHWQNLGCMHEWDYFYDHSTKMDVSNVILNDPRIQENKFVIWNNTFQNPGYFQIKLTNFSNSKQFVESDSFDLNPFKNKIFDVSSLTKEFESKFPNEKASRFYLRITGQNVAEPLSFESTPKGDFHIHHY